MSTAKNGHVPVVESEPVGLAAALELARLKYPVRMIEKKTESSTRSKVFGINVRTQELMEPSGVTERLLEKALKIQRLNFLRETDFFPKFKYQNLSTVTISCWGFHSRRLKELLKKGLMNSVLRHKGVLN